MERPTPPQRGRPLASLFMPLDSRLRGNDSRVRRGDHPTTNPAPSVTPVGPLPSFPPVPSVLPVGPLRPSRRSPPSFPPLPSITPASPPSVIPAGCKRESMVFSPPPKTDMRRPTTPTRPAPGSRPLPLDSRLRGNDSHVRRGERPTTTPAPSVTPTGPLVLPVGPLRHSRRSPPSLPPVPSVTPTGPLRHSHQPHPSLPPVRLCPSRQSPLYHSRRL